MSVQWGDVAAWVQGVGTVGAISVAFWQINGERRHRREAKCREDAQARRSQATLVAAWVDSDDSIVLWNQSELPVYEVVACLVMIQGTGPSRGEDVLPTYRAAIHVLPPGRMKVSPAAEPDEWRGMSRLAGAEIGFTDSAGTHWLRRAQGSLNEIETNAVDYYEIPRPF